MLDQQDEQTLVTRSDQLIKDAKYQEALPVDRELLRRFPENPIYKEKLSRHLSLAGNACSSEQWARAMEFQNEAILINDANAAAYNNRGVVWNNRKNCQEAVKDYTKAIERKGDDPDFFKNRGDCLYDLKNYNGAIKDYTMAIELNKKTKANEKDFANIYNDRGLTWTALYQNDKAIDDYKQAIAGDDAYVYAHHNLYLAYIKAGTYDMAYTSLEKAKALYREHIAKAEKPDEDGEDLLLYYRFLAELHLYVYTDKEMLEIENLISSGLTLSPDDWDLNVTAVKYYSAKIYLVCEGNSSRDKVSFLEDKVLARQNDCLRDATRYYKTVIGLYSRDPLCENDWDKKAELAGIHLLFNETAAAEMLYDQALAANPDHTPSLIGKGVIMAGRKNYDGSIGFFKKAAELDMDDLNIKSNIAEAHFRNGHYTDAENCYKRILALAAHNQDAVIGLGELFKTMGDQAKEKNNKTDAEDYYKWAENWYGKALDWQVSFDAGKVIPSRRLSMNDIAGLYYSIGYIQCSLYELTASATRQDRSLLTTAAKSFQHIYKGTDEYYKAQASIRKIEKALDSGDRFTTKIGAWMIIVLALLLLAGTQIIFFFPGSETRTSYSVSSSDLRAWAHREKVDKLYPLMSKIADTPFLSLMAMNRSFHSALGTRDSVDIPDVSKIASIEDHASTNSRLLSEPSYIAISFGCLIFIIAGFFMGQISKLKVAGLELEKNTIEQINTSQQSLGISPTD